MHSQPFLAGGTVQLDPLACDGVDMARPWQLDSPTCDGVVLAGTERGGVCVFPEPVAKVAIEAEAQG